CYQTAQKTALCAPASTQEVSESENPPATGHSPLRGLGGGLGDASPARRGSRSRPPLRRPRPLRFERLRMSGSECGIHTAEAASALRSRKTEKGGEGKTDANLTIFLSTYRATRRSESFSPVPRARGHHHSPGTA